jgi:hypothetical protein
LYSNSYTLITGWCAAGAPPERLQCDHNFFFRKIQNSKQIDSSDWGGRIKKIFAGVTNILVAPKELRKMYVTFLNNNGATNAELKGAAKAMHHSSRMQEKIYNSQTILEAIAPVYEFNERMHKQAFGKPE